MGRLESKDRIRHLPRKFGIVDIGFYSDHIESYRHAFSDDQIQVFFLERYAKNKLYFDRIIFDWLGLNADAVDPANSGKSKEDSNANFRIIYDQGVLAFKDGLGQVRRLKAEDSRYKKMLEIEPPIVEPEDIEFLNSAYADEILHMHSLYPDLAEIWSMRPTLADY
ncbi:hypothetical protein C100_20990 [Sphingobium sp. C100]|nr:hypothetical protein C100_20990 [Sphingobium sp. C100]